MPKEEALAKIECPACGFEREISDWTYSIPFEVSTDGFIYKCPECGSKEAKIIDLRGDEPEKV